jgi:hypothetical protein
MQENRTVSTSDWRAGSLSHRNLRLRSLLADDFGGNLIELSAASGVILHRLVEYLYGNRRIEDKHARQFESECGKPRFWMDNSNPEGDSPCYMQQ